MASKLLRKGSELYGRSKGAKDYGLKMSPNDQGVKIAPVSGPGNARKRGGK